MAIYRFEAKIVSRSDNPFGRSVVACAAYRSGTKLSDVKYGTSHDYSRRKDGIVSTEILTPDNAPSWASNREQLWNAVEKKEDASKRHKSAQLSREFMPAIPVELTPEQRRELVLKFAKEELVERGMIADISIHESKDGRNPHAHILCTMRDIGPEGFGNKRRDWNETALLVHWRKSWENHCNAALEEAGEAARVDCRSLSDQGIDREPQPKIGVAAQAMERKGIATERGKLSMWTKIDNLVRSAVRGIERNGEVPQAGTGRTWWQRAQVAIEWTTEQFGSFLRDEFSGGRTMAAMPEPAPASSYWQDRITTERGQYERETSEPEMDFG